MITDNLKWKKDSVLAEKIHEAFKKEPTHRPIMGGLITDPVSGRIRKLEERIKSLEDLVAKLIKGIDGGRL